MSLAASEKRLGAARLTELPPDVRRPGYAREGLTIGHAHIGVGAFHRCHQAEFVDDMLEAQFGPWGIVGINLAPPRLAESLAPQDCLDSRTLRKGTRTETRVIGALRRVIDAADSAGSEDSLAALASPDIKLVTMTVTEKGYGLTPATGALDPANAELAAAALRAQGIPLGADPAALRSAAAGYAGLPGRFREIGRRGGVRYIDDGLATNVLPTLAALRSLEGRRLAILVGGHDRGIDYAELIDALAGRAAPTLVVGLPESGVRMVAAVAARGTDTESTAAGSIDEAVGLADEWIGEEGVVLLSPAAPSFSQFANWKERSEAFGESVRRRTTTSDQEPRA